MCSGMLCQENKGPQTTVAGQSFIKIFNIKGIGSSDRFKICLQNDRSRSK
jgi:hypothetical protein